MTAPPVVTHHDPRRTGRREDPARGRLLVVGDVEEETIRRIERSSGALATQSVAKMDDTLAWFRALPANQRSWVTLVAQAGVSSFVEWMRSPTDAMSLATDVFGAAPPELTRTVSLRQTVEMVRVMVGVVEERVPLLAAPGDEIEVRESMLRFSREIAFAAARVYAGAAESRGAWDARLESLVIDGLVRGTDTSESAPSSQAAALGWHRAGSVAAIVGGAPDLDPTATLELVHRTARRLKLDCMAGVHADRLVVVVGGVSADVDVSASFLDVFAAEEPVVAGPLVVDIAAAGDSTRAALNGLSVVAAWPAAPRPVAADELLAERALSGEAAARHHLVRSVYAPLLAAGDTLLSTIDAYFDGGSSLEATARALFVHPNTVRYRLRRVATVCGLSPTQPREAYTIRIAIGLGRLSAAG
ncbi:MAG: PucR family transcriptional regulator [Jatrophihabitans sp.]